LTFFEILVETVKLDFRPSVTIFILFYINVSILKFSRNFCRHFQGQYFYNSGRNLCGLNEDRFRPKISVVLRLSVTKWMSIFQLLPLHTVSDQVNQWSSPWPSPKKSKVRSRPVHGHNFDHKCHPNIQQTTKLPSMSKI